MKTRHFILPILTLLTFLLTAGTFLPQETPPGTENVIDENTFPSCVSAWNGEEFRYYPEDSKLHFLVTGGGFVPCTEKEFTNYTYEADVTLMDGDPANLTYDLLFGFRHQNFETYQYYDLTVSGDGWGSLWYIDSRTEEFATIVVNWIEIPDFRLGESNHLKVVVADDVIDAYVNNTPIVQMQAPNPISGLIGYAAYNFTDASLEQHVVFENMVVTETSEEAAAASSGDVKDEGNAGEQTGEPAAASQPISGETSTWLVMLYQVADDEMLEQDIFIDLNEAEMVGSSDQVTIVSQLDRYQGGFAGDGDWTSTKRFLISQDADLTSIGSTEIADLGEVNSGDWNTLVDFATWAIQTYPAEKYVLILADHGAGWLGGWSDPSPTYTEFTTNDIDKALNAIIENTGIGLLDLVGFDACLMGQIEPLFSVTPYAKVAVASEEVEPGIGWAYSGFLRDLVENPGMSEADLGTSIVDSYIVEDGRITDDEGRSALIEEWGYAGQFTAEEIAEDIMNYDKITLTAVNLSAMSDLNTAFNNLASALTNADQSQVAEARAYAQAFQSLFGEDDPSPYLDLGHFTRLIQESITDDAAISGAAQEVLDAIDRAIIAEKHSQNVPGASGFSFYFPNSGIYQLTSDPYYEIEYTAYASRFASASLWDDFLLYHYTGRALDPASADPTVLDPIRAVEQDIEELDTGIAPVAEEIQSPGAGIDITIAPLTFSAEEINIEDYVTLTTEVSGGNIAYVFLYVGYYDEEYNSILTANMEFYGAEETKEINGVYYPDWGPEGVGEIILDWEPTLYFMSDGVNEEFAFFEPETYGLTPEEDTYIVYGVYTFMESGKEVDAIMRFTGDGFMKNIYGYTGELFTGSTRQITPQPGDTFTILEEWLDFDENPEGEYWDYFGATMTFGDQTFEWVPYYGYLGDYVLGILVEDLDGNMYAEYKYVTVSE